MAKCLPLCLLHRPHSLQHKVTSLWSLPLCPGQHQEALLRMRRSAHELSSQRVRQVDVDLTDVETTPVALQVLKRELILCGGPDGEREPERKRGLTSVSIRFELA